MNAVLYYSNSGESKRIAEYLADKTGFALIDLNAADNLQYERALLVFPVYCQNVPQAVKEFLRKIQTEYLALIATYGRASHGNVLNEIQREHRHRIIAAAYLPTKHSYVDEERFDEFDRLTPFIEKLDGCGEITIPRSRKNPFASFAPEWRSRIGVKIVKNARCSSCGTCDRVCPQNAIQYGKPNGKCIRCTKCVVSCPQGALTLKTSRPMRAYLNKRKHDEIVIYT